MWQCSNCGTTNQANLCRQCGLPAYQGDPEFEAHLAAGEYDVQQSPAPARVARPRRRKSRAGWIFCLSALLLTALALGLSLQPIYRFRFTADTENISQTLQGVLDYVDFDLVGDLNRLSFDGTYSVRELYRENGEAEQTADKLRLLTQKADEALGYLQYYGYADAGESIGTGAVNRLINWLFTAKTLVKVVLIALAVLIGLAALLLLLKKPGAAGGLLAFVAAAVALLPIAACTVLNKALALVGEGLAAVIDYGIGFRASLAITGGGLAVIILSALALVCVLCSRVANALSR